MSWALHVIGQKNVISGTSILQLQHKLWLHMTTGPPGRRKGENVIHHSSRQNGKHKHEYAENLLTCSHMPPCCILDANPLLLKQKLLINVSRYVIGHLKRHFWFNGSMNCDSLFLAFTCDLQRLFFFIFYCVICYSCNLFDRVHDRLQSSRRCIFQKKRA